MTTLEISESYVNATTDTRYGDTDWYEPFTGDKGKLYRSLVREYGRCTSNDLHDDPQFLPQCVSQGDTHG